MSAAEAFWGLFVLLSVVILSVDCRFVGTLGALCLAFCRDFVVVWSGGLLSVGSLGIGCSEEVRRPAFCRTTWKTIGAKRLHHHAVPGWSPTPVLSGPKTNWLRNSE
jgi:hypothetical protein